MRPLLPLLLCLAVGAGCGEVPGPVEPDQPETAEDRAKPAPGPTLVGRSEATQAARARRKAYTMASLSIDERVMALFTPGDLQILRHPDTVRLITGDPDMALSEGELAEGVAELEDGSITPSALVGKEGEREELAFRLLRSVAGSDGSGARCFIPEHTIRFCRDGQCMEVSICFGCKRLSVWADGEEEARYGTLDKSLRATVVGLCRKYGLAEADGC